MSVKLGQAPIQNGWSVTIERDRPSNLSSMTSNQPSRAISQEGQVEAYFARMVTAINHINKASITELLTVLSKQRNAGSTVFIAGNGGSASTAEHIALDWMLGTGLSSPPLRVVSLAQSSASITATGNDFAFEDVFSRQLKSLARKGDLLVVISASGNSPNMLKLVEVARTIGVQVIAMTGFDGGRLAQIADLSVHVPTAMGDYGVAEDLHLMVGHIVKEALIAGENSGN